jgi:hypothetical protein
MTGDYGEYEARLVDITRGPWHEQSIMAREKLRTMTAEDAQRYFRYHDVVISDPDELAFRESFDKALEELQILELAICSGYLPLELIRPYATSEFQTLLHHTAARRYVALYDFASVRFLAARFDIPLTDIPVKPPPIDARAGLRFATFLAVHSDFVVNPAIKLFTQVMDDYQFDGLIDAPFLSSYLRAPSAPLTDRQRSTVQTACLGFVEFLQVLGDLFLQLEPDQQPLYGCVYAYWLAHFFGLRPATAGYQREGVAFQELDPVAVLSAAGDEQVSDIEQERLRARVTTLNATWAATRQLLESIARN